MEVYTSHKKSLHSKEKRSPWRLLTGARSLCRRTPPLHPLLRSLSSTSHGSSSPAQLSVSSSTASRQGTPSSSSQGTALPSLKNSLSLALERFYPLSGNLAGALPRETPHILCSKDSSVAFTAAVSAADFDEITSDSPQDASLLHPLVPPLGDPVVKDGTRLAPLLSVQRDDLVGRQGILLAARAIGAKVKELGEEGGPLRALERLYEEVDEMAGTAHTLSIAGTPRQRLYDTDFGWGRPWKSVLASTDTNGSISLGESKEGDGGLELGLASTKSTLDAFSTMFDQGLRKEELASSAYTSQGREEEEEEEGMEVVDRCQIFLPPDFTPPYTVPLAFLHLPWFFFTSPVQNVLFYSLPAGYASLEFTGTAIPSFKNSLTVALQRFYPLSGCISGALPRERPHILCSKDSSVAFTAAVSAADFDEITSDGPQDASLLYPLVPPLGDPVVKDGTRLAPLLSVQVCVHTCDVWLNRNSQPSNRQYKSPWSSIGDIVSEQGDKRRNTYFGNCLSFNCVYLKRDNLIGQHGILLAARAIGAKVKELGEEGASLRALERHYVEFDRIASIAHTLAITGTPRQRFYDADFGWGRPWKSLTVHIDKSTFLSLAESREGDSGLELGLAGTKATLDAFSTLFEQGLRSLD
ncbi:hypothetical protein SAY86_018949 [Trapa natans]|uniref:Transferase n=1 Tax=Trapa natans TaxID=22666 RepID=A0AAN7LP98_TRANT|nr:hypothetical protein SAY86_018949 [Trapa natans]